MLLLGRLKHQMLEETRRPPASEAIPFVVPPLALTLNTAKKFVVSITLDEFDWNAEL